MVDHFSLCLRSIGTGTVEKTILPFGPLCNPLHRNIYSADGILLPTARNGFWEQVRVSATDVYQHVLGDRSAGLVAGFYGVLFAVVIMYMYNI
jgi:hypothetical protein